jgi:methyl-accepting chemotaxis protein
MTFSAPNRGPVRPLVQGDPLAFVLGLTERCFVEAGDSLARGVDLLNGTKALFARLDETLGDETGRHLAHLISRTLGNADTIRADFDGFLRQSVDLRAAVRSVRVEVGELDRVVRTIASVSINARILGNALMPPRPQVNSFIERLAQMSLEAEAILREVKDAMAGIGQDTDMMDRTLQDLRHDLMQQVLPALARFAAIAQRVQDGRTETTAVSAGLSDQMKAVFSEVSRLIVALQSGDSTRQRLQRVQDVLGSVSLAGHQAAGMGSGLDAVLINLARALVDAAQTDAEVEVDVSIAALEAVRRTAEQAMQSARQFYFAKAGRDHDGAASGTPEKLDEGLDRVRRHLGVMRGRAQALAGRLDIIMKHEGTIRQIAQQVRLSGLNAVLICAKLGEEGRSLRELAQWLRALTDESDAIVLRLQGNLAETRARTDAAGQAGVDRLEQALSGFIADAETLNAAMSRISSTVIDTARGFDAAGRQLPLLIGQAEARLTEFRSALHDLSGFSATLRLYGGILSDPDQPPVQDPEAAAMLARLRSRYTMSQERAIHDGVLATMGQIMPETDPSAVAPSRIAPPAAVIADASLDDILF